MTDHFNQPFPITESAKTKPFGLVETMRWFGPSDPVPLSWLAQAGCTGVVTALHQVPNGVAWTLENILERKTMIADAGLHWDVVESVPVHEAIKLQQAGFEIYIDAYCTTIERLGQAGVRTVTYNFMPVLDWTRTDLAYPMPDGSLALRFQMSAYRAFDLFVLKRKSAAQAYTAAQQMAAKAWFEQQSAETIDLLTRNIIAGLPGSEERWGIDDFSAALQAYRHVDESRLQQNLIYFLKRVTPIAEAAGVKLVIHPDDPPFPLFGLPRVVSTTAQIQALFEAVPSPANGLCFCTGSLGVRSDNDLVQMWKTFEHRVHFLHLRNTLRNEQGDFFEANHLEGDAPMAQLMQLIVEHMAKTGRRIVVRPDHGHQMLDDLLKSGANPGYTAIGRLRGLAELRGLEAACWYFNGNNLSNQNQ